jgi:predicted ATPase/class 3 adenylate cyclase
VGLVTFLFTDIERSTELWHDQPLPMRAALERHDALVLAIVARHGGYVFSEGGDGFGTAFDSASAAVDAARQAQLALQREVWPIDAELRIRMGIHTGEAQVRAGNYYGLEVNRASRVMAAGQGGQVLLSDATVDALDDEAPGAAGEIVRDGDRNRWRRGDLELVHLGKHRLKGIDELTSIWQLVDPDLPTELASLAAIDGRHDSLPAFRSAFFGRESDIVELRALIADHRLVTVTGPGGAGKTRVAVEAASGEQPSSRDGASFADLSILAPSASSGDVWRSIAAATRAQNDGTKSTRDSVVALLQDRQALVVLDNCEHVLDAVADVVDDLTSSAPAVTVLATSRETMALDGERVHRLPPLSSDGVDSPSVRLFVDRAVASDPTFLPDRSELADVAALCARLEGSPLAIELAASRVPVLRPADILANIDDRLGILRARRGHGRQTSLRATVEWSFSLLDPDEQAALRRLSVFDGSFDVAAAEAVVGFDSPRPVIDFLEGAAAKSLVVVEPWADGLTARFSLLDTIRAFGLERLAAAEEEPATRERAADHFHHTLVGDVTADPFIVASMRRRPQLVADWPGYIAALDWWDGEGSSAPGASTKLAELAAAMSYPWKDADDEARFYKYVGKAITEESLAPWLASFAHATYAWYAASSGKPDGTLRVGQAVQFAHETPNEMAALPHIVTAMLTAAVGWDQVALESGDAALRCAVDSRYAGVLVPVAHGSRGMALSGMRRYDTALEELSAAARLPDGYADDYDFLVRFGATAVLCHHLAGDHDAARAATDRLVERYGDVRSAGEWMMVVISQVVATCPFDVEAAEAILRHFIDQSRRVRGLGLDRHTIVLVALVDLYRGDERAAAESLALCDGPYEVLGPLVWEYRQRVEGWPIEELDQRRTASAEAWMAMVGGDPRISARVDAFVARTR